jgi:hypothetical protein
MGSPGNEMNVDVTQKKVPLTGVQDGSECHPGRTGFKYVEFFAKAGVAQARSAGTRAVRSLIANAVVHESKTCGFWKIREMSYEQSYTLSTQATFSQRTETDSFAYSRIGTKGLTCISYHEKLINLPKCQENIINLA